MKQIKKLTAMLLSGGLILGAMPVQPVLAADGEASWTATISLNETLITASGDNVTVNGTTATISASGSYEISGKLTNGQIIVNVPDEVADPGTVKLFFNGVDITGVSDAPIYIINAENTSINLMDGTENFLCDGETYSQTTAVIFAKDDITIKSSGTAGDGKLTVTAAYQHGLHCNNDVKLTGGNLIVKTETGDAIRGKTSVEIKGGTLDINSGGDGVKSTKGDVLISGGDIEIKASNDAVQGETSVQISGGTLKANGDRGLTNANTTAGNAITITGGEVFATATDSQAIIADNTQPVLLFNTATEQVKDQRIELWTADEAVFSRNPNKKFDYVLISSPNLTAGTEYQLYIGGSAAEAGKFLLEEGVTTLTDVVSTAVPGEPNMDINEDGDVDVSDAVLLARFIAEDKEVRISETGKSRADTNCDGALSSMDVIQILKKIARITT